MSLGQALKFQKPITCHYLSAYYLSIKVESLCYCSSIMPACLWPCSPPWLSWALTTFWSYKPRINTFFSRFSWLWYLVTPTEKKQRQLMQYKSECAIISRELSGWEVLCVLSIPLLEPWKNKCWCWPDRNGMSLLYIQRSKSKIYPLLGTSKHLLIISVKLSYVLLIDIMFSMKVSHKEWSLGHLNWTLT